MIVDLEVRASNRPEIDGASMCFGATSTGGRQPVAVISAATAANEERIRRILKTLRQLPGYPAAATFSSLQIGKNHRVGAQRDKDNFGPSLVTTTGDYSGGELVVDAVHLDPRGRVCSFDGRAVHFVKPFEGERNSLVAFTHSLFGELDQEGRDKLRGMGFPIPSLRVGAKPTDAQVR